MRWLLPLLLFTACQAADKERELAERTCGSCHAFPEPALLPQKAWTDNVLPEMGKLMGLSFINGQPVKDLYTPSRITPEEYVKIREWYAAGSPSALPDIERPEVKEFTPLFSVENPLGQTAPPSTTFVRIDSGRILSASLTDSSWYAWSPASRSSQRTATGKVIVDAVLPRTGDEWGLLTHIGLMHPNNGLTGSLHTFRSTPGGRILLTGLVADSLPRPVATERTDLDRDGRADYLVSGYGHGSGGLYWIREGNGAAGKTIIYPQPGCLRTLSRDMNGDGRTDILALFAQADERLILFTQEADGSFTPSTLLRFPPVQGSSYFDLADLNGDGREDILYTSGDNADLTSGVRKGYHGVYGYLQNGKGGFEQGFFFPMHGCFKALARDFDRDGDMDIAAISYFPDTEQRPQEAFLYLSNSGGLKFKPFTIPQSSTGNWLTMDAGDADGDGDVDLVIGSLVPPGKKGFVAGTGPAWLLLRNNSQR